MKDIRDLEKGKTYKAMNGESVKYMGRGAFKCANGMKIDSFKLYDHLLTEARKKESGK